MTASVLERETTSITSVVTEEEITTSNDKENVGHYVMDVDRERDDPHTYAMEARVEGFAVTAVCGFVWILKQAATGLPVCQECLDIYSSEDRSDESGSHLPNE